MRDAVPGAEPPFPVRLTAGGEAAGERVDRFVARALERLWAAETPSRAAVQRAVRAGLVRVAGRAVRGAERLRPGDLVEVLGIPAPERGPLAPEARPLRVVYEDAHLVVVDKPAGMAVHPAPGTPGGTVVNALLARYGSLGGAGAAPGDLRPGVVHRLDKDTTGLLVVARTAAAGMALRQQIAARAVLREYLVLVRGEPPEAFAVDAPVGRAPERLRMAVMADGRPARTHFRCRERFAGPPPYALLEARLDTGRTHQVRLHLAASGFPVAGDPLYGTPATDRAAGLELTRQALHAWRLAFRHPADGRPMEFASGLPADMEAALTRLRRRAEAPAPA